MILINKKETLKELAKRVKDSIAKESEYYLMGLQDAAEVIDNMPPAKREALNWAAKMINELREYANGRKGELAILVARAADVIEVLQLLLHGAEADGKWIPTAEHLPEVDEDGYSDKVLLCFDNCTVIDICEYRVTDGVGKWYVGDTEDSPEDIGLKPVAWTPLPARYRRDEEC